MSRKAAGPQFDPENPEWTKEDFARAKPASEMPAEMLAAFPKARGRPKDENRKVSVSIRLSPDVIEHFKSGGPGWHARIDATLKQSMRKKSA